MESPKFSIDDVRYADSPEMFARAEKLYKDGKVQKLRESGRDYYAAVLGSHSYEVSVSNRNVDVGYCTCPMGERDMLCKHMLAVALAVLHETGGSEKAASPKDLTSAKRGVSAGIRKLRPYRGPSSTWFSYQRSLSVGSGMIIDSVADLSASREHAEYLWKLMLRLSKKLATGGIDDSDGTVGGCIDHLITQLGRYAHENTALKPLIEKFCEDDTGFGFEDELRSLL